MKLLHTSDWHLGMTYRNGITYEQDQRYVINSICNIAKNKNVDGILIAGDVFDKSIASQDAIKLYDEIITYICTSLHIPVYMIAGNHDGAERLSQCSEILKLGGLNICGSLSETPYVINKGDVDIYLLPWISTDKVKSVYYERADEINSLEDAYNVVLNDYRSNFVKGHKNILLSHSFITNAETSVSDRSAEVGKATMIGSYVFEGFDYVALGHLHRAQQINDKIRYSGTPMAYSFGKEESQEKSVTIIDTDNMDLEIIPLEQLHRRITIKDTLSNILNSEYEESILNGYVKLVVTDSFVGLETMSELRNKFRYLFEVEGKSFDHNDETITMTVEEYEQAYNDPEFVFSRYCEDVLKVSPSEKQKAMFLDALSEYEKELA